MSDTEQAVGSDSPPPLPPIERLQELLHEACRLGRDDMISPLIQAGARLQARDAKGYTALILASYNDHAATTEMLLDLGADVNAGDAGRGNTALMGVAFKGYEPIARLLIARGAQVDATNKAGQTALMNAAMFGHFAIVKLLIDEGANPQAADAAGNSPMSLAISQNNAAMLDQLKRPEVPLGR